MINETKITYINRDIEALNKAKEEQRAQRDENRGEVFNQIKSIYITGVILPVLLFVVFFIVAIVLSKKFLGNSFAGVGVSVIALIPLTKLILSKMKKMMEIPAFANFVQDKLGTPEVRLNTFLETVPTPTPTFEKKLVDDKFLIVPVSLSGKNSFGQDAFYYFEDGWFIQPTNKEEVVVDFSDCTLFCPECIEEEIEE
jgi:hypothetical protein